MEKFVRRICLKTGWSLTETRNLEMDEYIKFVEDFIPVFNIKEPEEERREKFASKVNERIKRLKQGKPLK